jgi:hypothetical protein
VLGDIVGNVTASGDSPVIISAFGQDPVAGATSDVAIGKIRVGGRAEWVQIFAGYDRLLLAKNADAQIGSVAVGGDWIASSIVAGARNLGDDLAVGGTGANADNVNFGNLADRRVADATDLSNVYSRIGSITIAGQVFGTPESLRPADQFGFVAEEIGQLKVGARVFDLAPGPFNDGTYIGSFGDDVTVHEIASAIALTVTPTASAKLVNATTVTYLDQDGDKVTVTFSKPLLTANNVNNVFHFDTGAVNDGVLAAQQLHYLDLRPLQSEGLSVTFKVARGSTGDGLVNVGAIESTGYDVGTVSIPGDLGRIDAGDFKSNVAGLGNLKVRTFGRLGLDSQGPATASFSPSSKAT